MDLYAYLREGGFMKFEGHNHKIVNCDWAIQKKVLARLIHNVQNRVDTSTTWYLIS